MVIYVNERFIIFHLIELIVLNTLKMLKGVGYGWCNEVYAIPALKTRHEVPIKPHL